MSNNSDPMHDRYADMEFADAKPVAEVPALAQLQSERGATATLTIRVDAELLASIRARAEKSGTDFQSVVDEALRCYVEGQTLAEVVRDTIRQELHVQG